MPRLYESDLFDFSSGPLVTIKGQVIRGAGSFGQQVWIGSLLRFISFPSRIISWQGAFETVLGFIFEPLWSPKVAKMASKIGPENGIEKRWFKRRPGLSRVGRARVQEGGKGGR